MDDRALVAAMVSGDPRGLEGVYRRYADRIYTYCRSLLRDPDAAADAVHDTFIAAREHAGQLRDPDRLRSWLYAIARNECGRQLRGRVRHVPLDEAGDMSTPDTDPGHGVHVDELRDLVWAAADGLNPGDREVFELMIRHGLDGPDVAAVLGVSADHAHARLSRAKAQMERSLGALLMARTGGEHCARLAGVLRGWDGRLTTLLRKRISRHVESCSVCGEGQRSRLRPAALFAGYAAVPFLVAPAGLGARIRLTSGDPGASAAIARDRAARFDPATGFPTPVSGPAAGRGHGARLAGVAAVVALLLLLGVAAGVFWTGAGTRNAVFHTPPTPGGSSAVTVQKPTPARAPKKKEGRTAAPLPPTGVPSPTWSPPAVSPSAAPFWIQATSRTVCTNQDPQVREFALTVIAVSDSAELSAATAYWSPPPDSSGPMAVDGTSARTVIEGLTGQAVTWSVTATSVHGTQTRTEPTTTPNPCP